MIAFDTNIVVHSANVDSPSHVGAREVLIEFGRRRDVVVCELMLVELFLKLCNGRIFKSPLTPAEAGAYCRSFRANRNWRLIESAPVMDETWRWTERQGFAFRRLIDVRLGLTLRHYGVEEFATTNVRDFQEMGFRRVWNPLDDGASG